MVKRKKTIEATNKKLDDGNSDRGWRRQLEEVFGPEEPTATREEARLTRSWATARRTMIIN